MSVLHPIEPLFSEQGEWFDYSCVTERDYFLLVDGDSLKLLWWYFETDNFTFFRVNVPIVVQSWFAKVEGFAEIITALEDLIQRFLFLVTFWGDFVGGFVVEAAITWENDQDIALHTCH
jgi:hypothetical protein